MQPTQSTRSGWKKFFTSKWVIGGVILIVLIILFAIFHKKKSPYQFVTVKQGTISETVDVTGNTTPTQSVSLAFGNSGTISSVHVAIGDQVSVGEILASLNTANLQAQLAQAQANVDTQNAKLEGLKAGAQPEDIQVSQAALASANQTLTNSYGTVSTISNDSFAKANDAVKTQLSNLFSNATNNSIQLTFGTTNSQAAITAKSEMLAEQTILSTWQSQLATLSSTPSNGDLDTLAQNTLSYLTSTRQLLTDTSAALNNASSLDATTLAAYKSSVSAGINEVNVAMTNVNTVVQNIASDKIAVSQANAALNLKLAGSTQSDIDAQQAQVEDAQASVQAIQAQLQNSIIVAPISGVVTQEDAKVGQIASPATPLISIISSNQFEVDALVPETDIGKIAVGDSVNMTFDAFVGQTFTGKVFYIDPAQTITAGVVDYKIKVSFDTPNAAMKSGLTADLSVQTKTDTDALIVPQYAVIQNDSGNFVEVVQANVATQTPVTLGIQDESGNVEILSGVTAGEQVVNIGLKQ